MIAVSHDRYFLRRIATRVITVEDGKLIDYQGDYEVFLEKSQEESAKIDELETRKKEIEKSTSKPRQNEQSRKGQGEEGQGQGLQHYTGTRIQEQCQPQKV